MGLDQKFQEVKAPHNGYKVMLTKLVDLLKNDKTIPIDELLNKMIGMASEAGLEDIKTRILDG